MPLAAGTRLGPYEILAAIGEGGMGEVYKARDTRLNRVVALKVSKEHFSERFEREARAVAALNHPNICILHDVGPNYLVMEFVEGAPLRGPMPVKKALEYSSQILDALDAAHRKGITHRDLKPANILVTKQGIKLLDFGLAKQAVPVEGGDSTITQGLTGQGQILGTLQYMSPEQLQNKETDARSDLFSFGCVLYEVLTGKRAFEGTSAASVIAAILEREPAPLPNSVTGVGHPMERIIRRALAKDPDQRFQTARDLKAALEWALEESPPAASTRIPASRWWIGASIAALLIGALGGWAFSHFRKRIEEPVLRLDIIPPEGGRFVSDGIGGGGSALSPDGRIAAFVASLNGKAGLWVRLLKERSAQLLPGTEGASDPFWSPDSRSIAFFAGGRLQRVDAAGGSPLPISEVPAMVGGAWDAEGRIIFGTLSGTGLFQVSATGGKLTPLTTLDAARGENTHRAPQILPGGRFLYFARSDKPEYTGIYIASFSKPAERTFLLTTDANAVYAPDGDGRNYLLWLRGGTLMAQEFDAEKLKFLGDTYSIAAPVFSVGTMGIIAVSASSGGEVLYSSAGDVSQLTWFDRTGTQWGTVGEPSQYTYPFRLSPDAGRVAVTRDRPGGNDVWLLDVARGISSRFAATSRFNSYPIWSPDSRTIMFTRGNSSLFRKQLDGTGEERQVIESPLPQYAQDWSRDGRFLIFQSSLSGQIGLSILPVTLTGELAPGAKSTPYQQSRLFQTRYGRFSPEPSPRWIAFQSDETGRYEAYIQTFPEPHGKFQVSTAGGQFPQWGPGARELFYLAPDNRLMAVELNISGDVAHPSVPRALFTMPIIDNGWPPYDTSPDGQRFLVRAVARQVSQALTVIVNWPALLKRGAAAP